MLPDISIGQVTDSMGVGPSTPDSLPIIGPHPEFGAILFATGHVHMDLSETPVTAAIIRPGRWRAPYFKRALLAAIKPVGRPSLILHPPAK